MPRRKTDVAAKAVRSTVKRVKPPSPDSVAGKDNGGLPLKPAWLAGRAAEIWDQFAPERMAAGMLTHRDELAFALWCQLGAKVEEGELSSALITQFRLLGNDFGMSPSGKGREQVAVPLPTAAHKFFRD